MRGVRGLIIIGRAVGRAIISERKVMTDKKRGEIIRDYIITVGGFDDATNWRGLGACDALREQVRAVMGDRDAGGIIRDEWRGARHLAQGGQWAVYIEDARDALREVFGVFADYEDTGELWEEYTRQCADAVVAILAGEI